MRPTIQGAMAAAAVLVLGTGCGAGAAPRPRLPTSLGLPRADADSSLFFAILRSLPRETYHRLEADPRPLKADPSIGLPHRTELAEVAPAMLTSNRAAIERLGGKPIDAYADAHCQSGPGSLGEASADSSAANTDGDPRPFCVVVGLPREGGAYFPPGQVDARGAAPANAVTSRVVVTTPSGQTGYDVVAVPTSGGWQVVDRVQLWREWS